jgi:glycolate oxidase FAD binding subunit
MTVAGLEPAAVVAPVGVDEFAACVAELYARDRPFAFAGGGTELELGNAPRALDTLVQTTACANVIDYAPQDQTITLEAGMTLAAAGSVLARERQFLAIDAPDPGRMTIGGAIATNVYGGRRLRYGSIKDSIVGVEIVRPDGTRARGGGRVVKNVAGFDMPKLMVGSLGTLGAIVNATFRVYPIAEAQAAVVFHGVSSDAVMRIGQELISAALVPAAVVAYGLASGDGYDCRVSFEGFARGVNEQVAEALQIAGGLGVDADVAAPVEDWTRAGAVLDERERTARCGSAWHFTVRAQPTALARFVAQQPFAGLQHIFYPLLGTAFVGADTFDAVTLAGWRSRIGAGSIIVNVMPAAARTSVETWGPPPAASLAIMRRLKANFDPKGLCNAGRFVGGL